MTDGTVADMNDVQRTHAYLRMLDRLVVEQPSAPRDAGASLFVGWFDRLADAPGSAAALAAAVAEAEALPGRCVHASTGGANGTSVARVLVEDGPLLRELDVRLPTAWASDLRDAYVCVVLAKPSTHEALQLPDGTPVVVLGADGNAALDSVRAPRKFPTLMVLSTVAAAVAIAAIILSFVYG